MSLKRRIGQLEARQGAAEKPTIVFITSYEACDDDPHCKAGEAFKVIVFGKPGCPSQVFERLPGETEGALLLRAGTRQDDGN